MTAGRLLVALGALVVLAGCADGADGAAERVDRPPPEACDAVDAAPDTTAEPDPDVATDPIEFVVDGDTAVMSGNIGSDIVERTCALVADDPDLTTIELADVPGSSTEGNQTLDAGLVVHEAGLATVVPPEGQIESGAVDYFLAGGERTVADGGCLGVHATEIDDGDGPVSAADLPRDHPEHQPFLEYFRTIGVPEDFYWFTLSAAPPAGIHYLTPDEMVRFDVVTGEPPTVPCPLADSDGTDDSGGDPL